MFWCKPVHCSKSTSTCSCSSRSENSLIVGGYLDLGRTSECEEDPTIRKKQPRKQTDSRHEYRISYRPECPVNFRPECPVHSNNKIDLKQDESKQPVRITIIEKKKSCGSVDQKKLDINQQRRSSSGLEGIAVKAASTLSNCFSYIFNKNADKADKDVGTGISDKTDEETKMMRDDKARKNQPRAYQGDDSTNKIQSFYPGRSKCFSNSEKQEKMNELIEKFKTETSDADDHLFDVLYNKLKDELDWLACHCPDTNVTSETETNVKFDEKPAEPQENMKNVGENDEGLTSVETKKENCMNKEEMQDMFADLKSFLEENVCICNKISNEGTSKADNKSSGNTGPVTPCGDDKSNCKCDRVQSKQENPPQPVSENKTKEIKESTTTSTDFIDFYNKLSSKLDEISQQCLNNKRLNDGTQDIAVGVNPVVPVNQVVQVNQVVPVNQMLPSEPEKSANSSPEQLLNHDVEGENNVKNDEIQKLEKENLLVGGNEESATGETKDTLVKAPGDEKTIPLDEFTNLVNELKEVIEMSSCKCTKKETGSDGEILANLDEDPVGYNENSNLTLLQRAAADPLSLSDLFPKQPIPFKVIESPPVSFYSAECSDEAQGPQGPQRMIGEDIGVNTQCKCFSDQVVQTFEDMKVSYGVVCQKQSEPGAQDRSEISDIQIRKKMSPDGDVEKIKVRIRLNDGVVKNETEDEVASTGGTEVGKSSKFVKSLADYKVQYETNESEIEDTKVVKNGSVIKIFIPLESLKAN